MGNLRRTTTLWLLLAILLAVPANADRLEINANNIKVYGAPEEGSEVIGTLMQGEAVPLSKTANIPNWKKILIRSGPKYRVGFVKVADIQGKAAILRKKGDEGGKDTPPPAPGTTAAAVAKRKSYKSLRNKFALGLSGGINYQYQGGRETADPNGDRTDIGALTGMGNQFGLIVDFPLSYRYTVEGYAKLKTVSVSGSATAILSQTSTGPRDMFLKETFLSVGALFKVYPSDPRAVWWWGGGAEIDKATGGTLKFGTSDEVALGDELLPLPTFVLVYGAIGNNFNLGKNFFLVPDLRLGGVVNTSPLTLELKVNFSFVYAF